MLTMLRAHALRACLLLFVFAPVTARADWSAVDVDGEQVRIYRDDFGRPHIFARTNRGLFTAYGYAVAEDRLWQLELNRRAARGKLAEIFGPDLVATDRLIRTVGYTDGELDEQVTMLSPADRLAFEAYVAGINRYLQSISADPVARLPFEFFALGGATPLIPEPWTVRHAAAVAAFVIRRFSDSGGRELTDLPE